MLDTLMNLGPLLEKYGLIGVFIASFIGNVVPYSAVPYLAFIAAYAASFESESRLLIAIVGGIGAALGKYVLYGASRYAGRFLSRQRREELEYFSRIFKRKGAGLIAIFLFAALPLPDDLLYVPLGVAKFSFPLFALAVLVGKIFLSAIAVFLGSQARWFISESLEGGYLVAGIIILLIATVAFLAAVIYIDWKKIFFTLTEKGGWQATKMFCQELFLVLTLRHPSMRGRKKQGGESS